MRQGAHPGGDCLHRRATEREQVRQAERDRRDGQLEEDFGAAAGPPLEADHQPPHSAHLLHHEEHITAAVLLALVDDIGIDREITRVAFNIDTSIKPAQLGNGAFSISQTSATLRRTDADDHE